MSKNEEGNEQQLPNQDANSSRLMSRRKFLGLAGGGVALGALGLAGINENAEATGDTDPKLTNRVFSPGLVRDQGNNVEPSPEPGREPTTLKEAADLIDFKIGTNLNNIYAPVEVRPSIEEVQRREFNMLKIATGWISGTPLTGDYKNRNELLNYYGKLWKDWDKANKMGVRINGAPVFWVGNTPSSLKNGSFSREELVDIMKKRLSDIKTVGVNFDNLVVVNEAYRDGDVFYKGVGEDYVDIAFEIAREAFPATNLVYNDFCNHTVATGTQSSRLEHTQKIARRLKSKGLIDKVGLQTIINYPEEPKKTEVIEAMQSYGLPVIVTECSVNIGKLKGEQSERYIKQADIYRTLFEAAIESGVCKEFITWQVGDKYSVWEADPNFGGVNPLNDPTLFDDNLKPKPAYYAVMDVFKAAAIRLGR